MLTVSPETLRSNRWSWGVERGKNLQGIRDCVGQGKERRHRMVQVVGLGLNNKGIYWLINNPDVLNVLRNEAPFFCGSLSILPCSPPTYGFILCLAKQLLAVPGYLPLSSQLREETECLPTFLTVQSFMVIGASWIVCLPLKQSQGPEECSGLFGLTLGYLPVTDPFPVARGMPWPLLFRPVRAS